jgi:hypothetical protein
MKSDPSRKRIAFFFSEGIPFKKQLISAAKYGTIDIDIFPSSIF